MKKSHLILFLLASFLYVSNAFAQANVSSTGISIQGIARDENNSALANIDQLSLQFKIYYLISGVETNILTQTANVKTDNFGVFSYVMSIATGDFTIISNNAAYLKVIREQTVFSNEKLQAVPYAIQAQNGVPTGTIMAYIGDTAPEGWLLCNGATFADNSTTAKLKSLLGGSTTTPDLTGMFLRGAGTRSTTALIGASQGGNSLKGFQADETRTHNHAISITTSSAGLHTHDAGDGFNRLSRMNNRYWAGDTDVYRTLVDRSPANPTDRTNIYESKLMLQNGEHTHTVTGNSAATVGTETRPINYGVTYIIKI